MRVHVYTAYYWAASCELVSTRSSCAIDWQCCRFGSERKRSQSLSPCYPNCQVQITQCNFLRAVIVKQEAMARALTSFFLLLLSQLGTVSRIGIAFLSACCAAFRGTLHELNATVRIVLQYYVCVISAARTRLHWVWNEFHSCVDSDLH